MSRCTADDFIKSYLNFYHNNTIHDVTSIVKQVYPDTKRAILKVNANRIIVTVGPYNSPPNKPNPKQMVHNWLNRVDFVIMKCSKDGKYYWVAFPCKLEIEKYPSQPTTSPGIPIEKLIPIGIVGMIGAYLLLRKR